MYALRPSWIGSTAAAVSMLILAQTAGAADSRSAEDWFREGVDRMGSNKLEEATTAFQSCVQAKPDLKECWYNLGVVFGKRRDFANEAKAYEKAIELDPKYARAHFNLGVTYEDLGRGGEALAHYDKAIAFDPSSQDAHLNRAMLLLRLERFDDAIAGFERAVAVQPENAEGYYDMAEAVLVLAGKKQEPQRTALYRRAISHFQQALERDPKHYRAQYNIGVVHHKLQELDLEVSAYLKTLGLKQNYTPALYNLAFTLRDKGDNVGAKAAFDKYLLTAAKSKSEEKFVEVAKREMAKL